MKGNNKLILNTATLIEAVQEWLDDRTVQDQLAVVTGITYRSSDYMFEVSLSEPTADGS
jgi:hypothetical protein